MVRLMVRAQVGLATGAARLRAPRAAGRPAEADGARRWCGQGGQTTAEYALVILAAAAVAIVLIAWARSSGKLPAFFDHIIDSVTSGAQ